MSGKRLFLLTVAATAAIFLAGCASFDSLNSNIVPPTLIEKTPLPTPPPELASRDFYLRMELLIGKDGLVRHVTLTKASGDSKWDEAAIGCIMKWKYAPALLNDKPAQMRIIQTARVVATPPVMMDLSVIVCSTYKQADSTYALLGRGMAFDSAAATFGSPIASVPSGHIGSVDIHQYPDDVQDELMVLSHGHYTHPLPLGPYYAIFEKH